MEWPSSHFSMKKKNISSQAYISIPEVQGAKVVKKWYNNDYDELFSENNKFCTVYCGTESGTGRWNNRKTSSKRPVPYITLKYLEGKKVLDSNKNSLPSHGATMRLCHEGGKTNLYIYTNKPELFD